MCIVSHLFYKWLKNGQFVWVLQNFATIFAFDSLTSLHLCLWTVHWFSLQMELFSTLLVRQVGNKVHFSWRKHWFIHPSPETRTVDPVHSWGHLVRWFCCVKFANKSSCSDSFYWSRSASYNNLCSRPLGSWGESIKRSWNRLHLHSSEILAKLSNLQYCLWYS